MARPRRGDIFRVKLYGRIGTELYGKGPEMERPCVMVSSDAFSFDTDDKGNIFSVYPRITVAPITSYTDYRDGKRPLCGVPIQLADDKYSKIESDVDLDPKNGGYYSEQNKYEGLEEIDADGRPYRSIIDCGELWTVNSFDPVEWPDLDTDIYDIDVRWERRHGALKELATFCMDAALQALIDGGIRYRGSMRFRAGDVIIADFPEPDRQSSRQQCLIVSASGIDAIRERIPAFGGTLEQCTVVPLEPATQPEDRTSILVNVHATVRREVPRQFLANCRLVNTIDWRRRKATYPPEWRVDDRDMARVREALRRYLDLPQ